MKNKKSRVINVQELGKNALASRNKLKYAALRLVNRNGYPAMRVEDIAQEAGLAKGLFYRYFENQRHIIHELAGDFFKNLEYKSSTISSTSHPYDALAGYIAIPIREFCENPGLLACMFELHGSFPELSQIWKDSSHIWNIRLGKYLAKQTGIPGKAAQDLAYVLAAMMEGIIYQDLIRNSEGLTALGKHAEQITEIIAICWYRTIFLELPPKTKIRYGKSLLAV